MYCTYTASKIEPSKIALLVVYVATCYQLTEHVVYALPIALPGEKKRKRGKCGEVRLGTPRKGGVECLGGGHNLVPHVFLCLATIDL